MDCQKFPVACAVAAATIMVATHEFLDDDETRSALPCNGGGKSHWEEEEDGGDTDENDDDDDADAKGVTMCSLLHTTNNSETSCLSEEDACPCRSPPGILIWGWVSHKSAPKPIHGHGHRCRHRDPVWGRLRLGIVVVVAIAAILVIPWQQNTQQSNTGKSGDSTAFHTTTTTLRKPPPPKPKPNQPVDTNNNNDAPLETGTTNGSEKTNQPAFVYPDTIPSVAWLLSFVGAGSSAYTLAAVAHFSNTSTATNYCGNANNNNNPGPVQGQNQHQEQDWMVPVHPDYGTSGPFVTQQKPWPKHFILTLTHCGNFCTDRCTPMVPTHRPDRKDVLDYAMQCGSGKRIFHNQERSISYDYHTIPKKIVHAIRNPFDSIVRRMLTTVAHTPESRSQKTPIPGMPLFEPHLYTATLEGVRHWCSYLDRLVAASTSGGPDSYYLYLTTSSIQFGSVPCAAEWYRYTQWHTMATQLVTEKLPTLPVHTLWVENYTLAWDTTMTDLMDFLQLDPVVVPMDPGTFESVFSHLDPPSFSEYGHLFDPDIRRKVGLMMRDLASNATWDLIRHYLEPDLSPIPNQTIDEEFSQLVLKGDTEPERIVSGNTTSNNEWKEYALEDDDTITDESLAYNEKFFASTPQAPDDANPQVVWLLSFPNSVGTTNTMNVMCSRALLPIPHFVLTLIASPFPPC